LFSQFVFTSIHANDWLDANETPLKDTQRQQGVEQGFITYFIKTLPKSRSRLQMFYH
jgi:hypothetical protein